MPGLDRITSLKDPEFVEIINDGHNLLMAQISNIAEELGIDESWASNLFYLRNRRGWTKELESEFVGMAKSAKSGKLGVDMFDWPHEQPAE